MAKTIPSLPTEMLGEIASQCPKGTLCSLRLTCRQLNDKLVRIFAHQHCSVLYITALETPETLQRIHHSVFGPAIRTLVVCPPPRPSEDILATQEPIIRQTLHDVMAPIRTTCRKIVFTDRYAESGAWEHSSGQAFCTLIMMALIASIRVVETPIEELELDFLDTNSIININMLDCFAVVDEMEDQEVKFPSVKTLRVCVFTMSPHEVHISGWEQRLEDFKRRFPEMTHFEFNFAQLHRDFDDESPYGFTACSRSPPTSNPSPFAASSPGYSPASPSFEPSSTSSTPTRTRSRD